MPSIVLAEVRDPISTGLVQEYVKKMDLQVTLYSSTFTDIDNGDVTTLEVQWDTDNSFTTPNATKRYSYATLESNGKVDRDTRKVDITITGITGGAKTVYFRVRNVGPTQKSDWDESAAMTTLPKKAWSLRVPKSQKVKGETVRLRWNHPRRCKAAGCDYFVKIQKIKKNGKSKLLTTEVVQNSNYLDLTSTTLKEGQRYRWSVKSCLTTSNCNPKYTKKKKFRF